MSRALITLSIAALIGVMTAPSARAEKLTPTLRYQVETSEGSGRYHRLTREENWQAQETAIIVCDMWDLHHCLNAVRRGAEFAPRLNDVLTEARKRGVSIIHAPSDCMDAYAQHPARKRAIATPTADRLPADIENWCSLIPEEQGAKWPIDQSDGGEDDDPAEHAEWAAKLKSLGRNPGTPWKKQTDLIEIDPERDYISDRGDEVWNILEQQGIKNVILAGVHTNMCVIGRPFGLRQMAKNGKNVVLMRDMTDTMYNPKRWPFVSHFTGTDLIVSHIERFVCPTITSSEFVGGEPCRFQGDKRPHVVILMAEDEYVTEQTLPEFAGSYLGKDFRTSYVFGSDTERNELPGLEVLKDADLLLISVRRRVLKPDQMEILRQFVASGRPVVGIRTASHSFAMSRGAPPPEGYVDWPEFDAQVFGGNYHGHHGNKLKAHVKISPGAEENPILRGVGKGGFVQGWSLYQTSPLADGTTVLMTGSVEGHPDEPVAWTFTRADGGRSIYTSMGHKDDFADPSFVRLLLNGIYWAAGMPIPEDVSIATDAKKYELSWSNMPVPSSWEAGSNGVLEDYDGVGWYRCAIRIPPEWLTDSGLGVSIASGDDQMQAWWNGHPMLVRRDDAVNERSESTDLIVRPESIEADEVNLLVVRVEDLGGEGGLRRAPIVSPFEWSSLGVDPRELTGILALTLSGNWQFRIGDDPSWSKMPLPAKFGTSTDIVFYPLLWKRGTP